jgi:UDP-N-acetyl-D-mannosaminuronic acid transferase (WecB/TagA/CpsF family)
LAYVAAHVVAHIAARVAALEFIAHVALRAAAHAWRVCLTGSPAHVEPDAHGHLCVFVAHDESHM